MRILGVVASSSREVPNAPTIGTATDVGTSRPFNNAAATVTFTAPTWTGGLPITSYTVTSSPGGITASGSSSPITITGLASNTNYTFTVTATNGAGTSAASAASNSILATTIPQAPTIGTATAGNASATVAYTANATGGKTVTYTATSSPGGFTGTGASPITVSGLTNGTAYTFTVTATNANGSATSAASNSITPVAPIARFWAYIGGGGELDGSAANSTATYFVGNTSTTSRPQLLFSYSKTGTLNWQRQLTTTSTNNLYGNDAVVDSSGNIYVLGQYVTASTTQFTIAKYDSSGNLQWQNRYQRADSQSISTPWSMKIDAANSNLYVGIGSNAPTPMLVKLDTLGNVAWARFGFQNFGDTSICYAAPTPAGNIYVVVPENYQAGKVSYSVCSLVKYGANGTPSRRVGIGSATTNGQAYLSCGVSDSADNLFAAGFRYYLNQRNAWIYKTDSNLGGIISNYFAPNTSVAWIDIVRDSSNNIYVAGGTQSGGYGATIVAKFDSSLNLQWQRSITAGSAGFTQRLNKIALDETNGRLAISGMANNSMFSAYIPTDGSGTGSYTVGGISIVYAASGYSSTTISDTTAASNYTTVGSVGMTQIAGGFTASTPSYSPSITTF